MNTVIPCLIGAGFPSLMYFYITNHKFRYYAKFTFFTFAALICASVYIPIMLLRPMNYKNALLPSWSLRQIGLLFGLTWEIRGKENIVQNSGCIVLINHQSVVDLLVMSHVWPLMPNCSAIAKKEIFYMWPFGLASWLWGTIFIDRLNSESARNTINKTAVTVNSRQARLCMFPEGTRHGGDNLLPFKKGAFHVAIQSQCPLQPVIVSRYHYIDHDKKIFGSGKNVIWVLPPVSTIGYTADDVNVVIDKVYKIMNEKYIELSKEVLLSKEKEN